MRDDGGTGGSWFQQRAALRSLAQHSERGDPAAIEEAIRMLGSSSADVRESAIQALADLAHVGDGRAAEALCGVVCDDSVDVQCRSLGALGAIGGDSTKVVESITAQMQRGQVPVVRVAALAALRQVVRSHWAADRMGAAECMASARDAVIACAGDDDAAVAAAAVGTLPAVAPLGAHEVAEAARSALRSRAAQVRAAALPVYASAASCSPQATRDVEDSLQDEEPDVRAAALAALARLVPEGDDGAIDTISRHAGDEARSVQVAALAALGAVAARGHRKAGFVVLQGLADVDAEVRRAAAGALGGVAAAGDRELLAALGRALGDADEGVRRAAGASLEQFRDPGDGDRLLLEICSNLHHASGQIRREVHALVERFGGRGRPLVLMACVEGLWRDQAEVRGDALLSLRKFCAAGAEADVLKELAHVAESDACHENRCSALQVIALVGKDREPAVQAVAAALLQRDASVRETAAQAMADVASKGNLGAIGALVELLPLEGIELERRAEYRVGIVEALEILAEGSDDARAVSALVDLTVDSSVRVRLAALSALERVAAEGNEDAVDAVASLLDCDDPATRNHAMSRFRFFSKQGDQEAAFAAAQRTQSESPENRLAALHALAGVIPQPGSADERAPPGAEVLDRLSQLLRDDGHEEVRRAASAILAHVAERRPIALLSGGCMAATPLEDARCLMGPGAAAPRPLGVA